MDVSVIVVAVVFGFLSLLAYWQLVIAEGVYLGPNVVRLLYDLTAHRYDGIKQFDEQAEQYFLGEPLSLLLAPIPNCLVLDVGVGTGRLPYVLFRQTGFTGRIVGIDVSLPMLTKASTKLADYHDRLVLVWRPGVALPFADEVFACVTCLEMLEFTPSPRAQLEEIARVLGPGGILVTTSRRGRDALMLPGKILGTQQFRSLLCELGFEHVEFQVWQVDYDLVWAVKRGLTAFQSGNPIDFLRCPECSVLGFRVVGSYVQCKNCRQSLPLRDRIIIVR